MALEPAPTRALTSSVRGPLGRSSQPLRRACPSHAIDFLRPSGRDPGRVAVERHLRCPELPVRDRKSTRLNSSHLVISYAVFCLKKKIIIIVVRGFAFVLSDIELILQSP